MHCTNCGQPLPAKATACPSCGQRVVRPAAPPAVPNYLVPAILVTLCCCVPFGIVAIVYAAQVTSKLAAGDITGAVDSSNKARMWSWIALAAGALIAILYVAFGLLGALGGA